MEGGPSEKIRGAQRASELAARISAFAAENRFRSEASFDCHIAPEANAILGKTDHIALAHVNRAPERNVAAEISAGQRNPCILQKG